MNKVAILSSDALEDRTPAHMRWLPSVDLVVSARSTTGSAVLYGRCAHRGALMSDGMSRATDLICGVHDWDYRLDSGVSEYNNARRCRKFKPG